MREKPQMKRSYEPAMRAIRENAPPPPPVRGGLGEERGEETKGLGFFVGLIEYADMWGQAQAHGPGA